MEGPRSRFSFSVRALCIFFALISGSSASGRTDDFLRCLVESKSMASSLIPTHVYTPSNSSSFLTVLQSFMFNLRFISPSTPKPSLIITPSTESGVQEVVVCAEKHDLLLKIRSGGHDFEGISYTSHERPFVLLDLRNFDVVDVDVGTRTAWIQVGSTLGQVYYTIASKSRTLGFPAGACPTVGAGGHIAGGGYGMMLRMYGMAADQVIDARIVLADGRVVDRRGMGEDVFWAIRGGGSAGFGVIIAWKVNLVAVPSTVTVFAVNRDISQNATELVHKWQYVANRLPKEITMDVLVQATNGGPNGSLTIAASFISLYLGRADQLVALVSKRFPELGLKPSDCSEMSWIESVLYFSRLPTGVPLESMLSRFPPSDQSFYKIKLDYFNKPAPVGALEGIWNLLLKVEAGIGFINFVPYGGRMAEVSSSAIPYPHRAGNLFHLFYYVIWMQDEDSETTDRRVNWTRQLYDYLTPYVSSSPRSAYINYRDLDIGVNDAGKKTNYTKSSVWGRKYFLANFDRLVGVKTKIDPQNIFRSEQSIPLLPNEYPTFSCEVCGISRY